MPASEWTVAYFIQNQLQGCDCLGKSSRRSHFTALIVCCKPGSTQNICCSAQPKHFLLLLRWFCVNRPGQERQQLFFYILWCSLLYTTACTGPARREPVRVLFFVRSCCWLCNYALDVFGWPHTLAYIPSHAHSPATMQVHLKLHKKVLNHKMKIKTITLSKKPKNKHEKTTTCPINIDASFYLRFYYRVMCGFSDRFFRRSASLFVRLAHSPVMTDAPDIR